VLVYKGKNIEVTHCVTETVSLQATNVISNSLKIL